MNMENIYTALINNSSLAAFNENKQSYKLLHMKECNYEKGYSIVEYQVLGKEPYDDDIDTMLDILGALIIHENGSNAFCLMQDDIEEIGRIYTWAKAANFMMADLLTSEEIKKLLYKKFDIHNNIDTLYVSDNSLLKSAKWTKITDDANLFNIDIDKIKVGENGREESVWLPYILGEYTDCYVAIKEEDDEEDQDKQSNLFNDPASANDFPWFDDNYYYNYEYGYNNKI